MQSKMAEATHERRELVRQIAFAEISEARPPKLLVIAAKAEALRVRARMFGDRVLEAIAVEIKERAERRLA